MWGWLLRENQKSKKNTASVKETVLTVTLIFLKLKEDKKERMKDIALSMLKLFSRIICIFTRCSIRRIFNLPTHLSKIRVPKIKTNPLLSLNTFCV